MNKVKIGSNKDNNPPVPTLKLEEVPKEKLATQTEIKATDIKRKDGIVTVPFKDIRIRVLKEGKRFNHRNDMGDLEALAGSIEEQGLLQPLMVYVLDDGKVIIEDGERRYRAIDILRKKSMELKQEWETVECRISNKELSDNERLIIQLTSNSGKPFEPVEEAEIFATLRAAGMNMPDIAKKTGRNVPYIEQRLLLADADVEEKEMIKTGKIKPTAYTQLVRKEKDPAKRKSIIKESTSKGKRVKVKDVKVNETLEMVNEALKLVKAANECNPNAKTVNVLFELDAQLRKIKKAVK